MMDGKKTMSYFVTTLLVLALLNILQINGEIVCPWCDKRMETDLLNCVYTEMISSPQLIMMPLRDVDDVKWKLSSDSDSMFGMPYAAKKVAMDDKFVEAMANVIKQNNYKNQPEIIDVVSELAGNCYSSVTGLDRNVVIDDIKKQVNENLRKNSAPLTGDPKPVSNSRMPFSANKNQQNNFQSLPPQIQPSYVNDAPFNPPGSPLENSYNYPDYESNAPLNPPGSPPVNSFDYPSDVNNAPFNPPGSPPVNSFDYPSNVNSAPFNPPGSPPVNSFDYPSNVNNAPFNPPGSPSENSFDYPSYENDAPFDPPVSSSVNPSSNPSFANNAAGPPENWPRNNYEGQGQDFSRNQAPGDDSSGTSIQNENNSQSSINSPDNSAPTTTASPKISSPPQDSKSYKSNSSDYLKGTTSSPHTDAPNMKTTGKEKSEDEVPCDEKFKITLEEKLINDDRFRLFFGKLPVSSTKPAVLEIMNHVFKEYGIQQHYTEFSTFWKFESKALNKESKVEDWAELISKICKIIFSRNDLLKEDCEKIGIEIADYILGVLPGDPPTSSTQKSNQNDGNDSTSTESNANSASTSITNTSPENNANSGNSTNPENLSFPELHSKLANILKNDGSSEQNSDDVPFSETLSTFEAEQNLDRLHQAAESCLSPSGFDFEKFLSTMSDVTDSIQTNHPNWSHDKCEMEMYSTAVAVMAELLQNTVKSSSKNAQSQSSSSQPNSAFHSKGSQSSNSGAQPDVPNYYDLHSDDTTYPGPGTDYDSGSGPQPQHDFTDYRDYPDISGPVNAPPYENQPAPSKWNDELKQPSNFAPGPINTNYGDSSNGNLQNIPFQPNYGSQDYEPAVPQNFPPQDYSAIHPANIPPTEPYSGGQSYPVNQNTGFQQSNNRAPNSGFMNSPNGNFGNNQFQAEDLGNNHDLNAGQPVEGPVLRNGNSQNFQPQFYQN